MIRRVQQYKLNECVNTLKYNNTYQTSLSIDWLDKSIYEVN